MTTPVICRRAARAIIVVVAGLILFGAGAAVPPAGAGGASAPRDLLVYYGWPSHINGSPDPAAAAVELGRYDFVVLGGGVESPDHPDNAKTIQILADPAMAGTYVFGYVNLGMSNGGLSLDEVRRHIDEWRAMGADAIHLDAFGYDWDVTRERQNAAVDYAHSLGMPVLANAWLPADAFGAVVDPDHNPAGLLTHLGAADYYLSESYRIMLGQYAAEDLWRAKAAQLTGYQAAIGFSVMSVTTNNAGDLYSEEMFFAAWNAAALDGHVATGWGEFLFSADDGLAPFRTRPLSVELPPGGGDPSAGGGSPLTARCAGVEATIIGTPVDDVLVGTAGPDVIAGLDGADSIDGGGGDDLICGGGGADTVEGGAGADRLIGGTASDALSGGAGGDLLRGSGGSDRLAGGEGHDRLVGGAGADELAGGDGDDHLAGQAGDDRLLGDDGFDRAAGGPQTDACEAERTKGCEG